MCDAETTPIVLVIDDSEHIHKLLKHRLASEDFELVSATNGAEGLRLAKEIEPAIIMLDLSMPMMDGFEVLRTLKDDPATMHTPVILISSSDDSKDKVSCFDLGATDYVCKPFDMAELRARIRAALRLHQLMHLLAKRAQIDGLTGLWNRTYFDRRLQEEISAMDRSDKSFCLALADLDNFKRLNDTHGHPAGDHVLQQFAKLLNRELRKQDTACRYGGEEFAIIMRDTDAEQGKAVLERIRKNLESMTWPRHPNMPVTSSFGLCDWPEGDPSDPIAWIETADKALYTAKKQGRNRVHVISAPDANLRLSKAG